MNTAYLPIELSNSPSEDLSPMAELRETAATNMVTPTLAAKRVVTAADVQAMALTEVEPKVPTGTATAKTKTPVAAT